MVRRATCKEGTFDADDPAITRDMKFFCENPDCTDRTLIFCKKSSEEINFTNRFRHQSKCLCETYSEPFHPIHSDAINKIIELLGKEKCIVEYNKIGGVRPDIFYDNQIVIEVQRSSISEQEIFRRNQIYYENGLISVWFFLSTNPFHNYHYKITKKLETKNQLKSPNNINLCPDYWYNSKNHHEFCKLVHPNEPIGPSSIFKIGNAMGNNLIDERSSFIFFLDLNEKEEIIIKLAEVRFNRYRYSITQYEIDYKIEIKTSKELENLFSTLSSTQASDINNLIPF